MEKRTDANLFKKYHKTLVYDYTEYPTKGNWSEEFGSKDYSNVMSNWLKLNPKHQFYFMSTHHFVKNYVIFAFAVKR